MDLSDATEVEISSHKYVYRLWDAFGACLYVGKHDGWHLAERVRRHHKLPWWNEVVRADYIKVLNGADLNATEGMQIRELHPRYNQRDFVTDGGTPIRSLRLEDDLWHKFGEKVQSDPSPVWRSRAAVLRAFIDFCTTYPGHMETLLRDLGDLRDLRAMLDDFGRTVHE